MMRLYGLSDLHLSSRANWDALVRMGAHPDDWLILAGDLCETDDELRRVLDHLAPRWGRLFWVPGNHELWTLPTRGSRLRGRARYELMVRICRERGVLTPEDDYVDWPGEGPRTRIAPLFTLYDYSFAPDGMTPAQAKAWALEHDIMGADEHLLHPDPFETREAWCRARCERSEQRLAEASRDAELVLVNHWPLRLDLVHIPRVPRYVPWCGTRRTEDWHRRFRASVVVTGHLHTRRTDFRDGVRFEEVSLGYPRDWNLQRGAEAYLRRILPHPSDS